MLHKLGLLLLSIAVLAYSLYLLARKRSIPNALSEKGLRRRFFLATAVCMAMMGASGCGEEPVIMCYKPAPPSDKPPKQMSLSELRRAIRAIWISLDSGDSARFEELVDEAVARGELDGDVGDSLVVAYRNTAMQHYLTRGAAMTCYDMAAPSVPFQMPESLAENLVKRVELLREAKAKGTLSAKTIAAAESDVANQIAVLRAALKLRDDWQNGEQPKEYSQELYQKVADVERRFRESLKDDATRPKPDDAAKEAARIVVEMETQGDFKFKKDAE